jgi:hypothetical protein
MLNILDTLQKRNRHKYISTRNGTRVIKEFDVFGMTYDQYVEGKEVHEHCFLRFISPALLNTWKI